MSSSSNNFYLTTTLPYVNSKPHMGHALEFVLADIIVRYQKSLGKQVFFNTGTDEHGVKIFRKAQEEGKQPQAYVDEYAGKFKILLQKLLVSPDVHFIRTTDPAHKKAAQEFWKLCQENGDIYKKNYKVKYCVGCELEKTESELSEGGRCLLHPNLEIEFIEEENYFFKFSSYQDKLLKYYEENSEFVVPNFRFNEIKQFVKQGLQDFSISRVKEKLPWGVEVPGDATQVMYVWFDALINYISTLGWHDAKSKIKNQKSKFEEFWPGTQIAGKDNLRQQSAMWQAMLMSAGLPNSKQIVIHGFITSGGEKMSKTTGNVVDPLEIIEKYGAEALRYWFAREISTFEDGDFTWEKFKESYNSGLANGIGNLTSRILKMAVNAGIRCQVSGVRYQSNEYLEKYEIQKYADEVWKKIKNCDEFIQKTEPFKTIKTDPKKAKQDILFLLGELYQIALLVAPILPESSEKILAYIRYNFSKPSAEALAEADKALTQPSLENIPRLFPRK